MATTIKNFLVGVGLDSKEFDTGSKEVLTNLSRIRSLAGIAGAALVGAFATAGSMALAAGQRIDSFTLSTERMSTSSGYVYNLSNALRIMGGDASDALVAITAFESALDQLKQGKYPFESLSLAGIDTSGLAGAQNGQEVARILAEMVPNMTATQQRVTQENFGLSDATMRLLRQGSQEFDAILAKAGSLTGNLNNATDAARAYNKELTELQLRFEGIGNTLAEKMLPAMTGVLGTVSKFIDDNRSKVDATADLLSQNPGATGLATAGAGLAAGGTAASLFGLKTAGGALSRLGMPGVVIGTGMLAADLKPDDIEGITGYRPSDYLFNNTPADAVRDGYNWGAGKLGLPQYEKDPNQRDWLGDAGEQYRSMESEIAKRVRERIDDQKTDGFAHSTRIEPRIQNNLDLRIELDGRAIESKVVDIIERREQATMDDLQTTTVR